MITPEEVRHIAKLARLGLSDQEVSKFQKELSSIVDYFAILQGVDTKGVEPMAHSVGVTNEWRKDEFEKVMADALRKAFPESQEGFAKVTAVFQRES